MEVRVLRMVAGAVGWALIAGVLAVGLEIAGATLRYATHWWVFLPTSCVLSYCLYRLIQASPSLPAAFVLFSLMTMVGRTSWAVWYGQPIGLGTWIGAGLVLVAGLLRLWWP